jgi:hypothetical protein
MRRFLSVSPKFSHFKSPFALPSGTQRPAEKTANAAQDRTADMHRKTVSTLEKTLSTLENSISTLENSIGTLENSVSTLGKTVGTFVFSRSGARFPRTSFRLTSGPSPSAIPRFHHLRSLSPFPVLTRRGRDARPHSGRSVPEKISGHFGLCLSESGKTRIFALNSIHI